MKRPAISPHERTNRAAKVQALITTIDACLAPLVREALGPEHADRVAASLARCLRDQQGNAGWWIKLASESRCNPPSAVTIAAVLAHYEAVAAAARRVA